MLLRVTFDNENCNFRMKFWLLLILYLTMPNRVVEGSSVVDINHLSDMMQQLSGQLEDVTKLMNKQQQQTRQILTEVTEQATRRFDALHKKIDQLNQTLNQQHEQQSQLLMEHFVQQVARIMLHQQELALCSLIPRPTVHHATQSVKRTSNETIITYTCKDGYKFNDGLTTRSTICNGASWTPVDGNCIEQVCRPVLTHVIRGDRSVTALTTLNDQLFVTRANSPIAVYDTKTFQRRRDITVPGAGSLLYGLASCPTDNYLYASDYHHRKVYKLKLSPTSGSNTPVAITSWYVGSSPYGLSVDRKHNLLDTGSRKVAEYTPSGSLVREISDSNELYHAVEHVVNGTFVVSRFGPVHGVALMSFDGRTIHSYGSRTLGSGPGQMHHPRGLVVDRDGYILVADAGNHRILVLNPTLSEVRRLPLPTDATTGQALRHPLRLWLDESRGRLYVGEWDKPYRVLVFDNVYNIKTLFSP